MCPPTEHGYEPSEPYGSGPRRPEPHGADPSGDPGHAADPYEALYRSENDAATRDSRPLDQYRQTVSAPEDQADDDRYGWLYRTESAGPPTPSPRETRFGTDAPIDEEGFYAPAPSEEDAAAAESSATPEQSSAGVEPAGQTYAAAAGAQPDYAAPQTPAGHYSPSSAPPPYGAVAAPLSSPDQPPQKRTRRAPIVITLVVVAALMGIAAGILVPLILDGGAAAGRAGDDPSRSAAPKAGADPYTGKVDKVEPGSATADCQAPDAQDDAGNSVTYPPDQVFDGDKSTAWRCDGAATDEKISFSFAPGTKIAEVGFINGYTKTDPSTEADRYSEYRRVLEATWTFPDGTSYQQRLNDGDERMQKLQIPVTEASGVVLTINKVTEPGQPDPTRDAVLISEVRFASPE